MLNILLFIILLIPSFAQAETDSTYSIVSTTRFEDTFDTNNQRIQYIEQAINLKTATLHSIPRLGYLHEIAYGISGAADFNSNSSSSAVTNFLKVYTSHTGSIALYGLRVTYVYDGGYDFKSNMFHDFDFDVKKEIPLSELIHSYIDAGYFHEQRVVDINSQSYSINNRDVFYKLGLYYGRPNYKLGIYYKSAYSISSVISDLNFRMNTIAVYSAFDF